MSEFIVLGLVPGTQIQITFILWILSMSILVAITLVWIAYRVRLFRNWIITAHLLLLTRYTPALK